MDGLLRAQFAYPDVDFRHVLSPSEELSSSSLPLNLTSEQMLHDIAVGLKDGQAANSMSVTHTADLLHFFGLKKKLD